MKDSSNPAVATIDPATGIATALSAGASAIVAIATNPDGTIVTGTAVYTVTVSSTTEPLASLAIVPAAQTATAANQTAHFFAIGTTGSGATVNLTNQPATINGATIKAAVWASSNPSVATVDPATGIATALSAGTTAITAMAANPDGTIATATAIYTVTVAGSAEPLASLAIVPAAQTALAVNQTAHFIAIGTTGSGATVNLTNQTATVNGATIKAAVWASSNPAVATVDPATGIATALSAGATAITAIASNPDGTVVSASAIYTVTVPTQSEAYVSLAIVPASQTATSAGQTASFIAIGTTGTGATVDLTTLATWSSSSAAVATITSAGQAVAVANGAAAITAVVKNPSNDGTVVSGSAVFTVSIPATPEPLISLAISPNSQSVASAGQTTQFLALGTFSATSSTPGTQNMANISTYTVVWYSSNPAVATINSATGVATGVGPGVTAITAIATNNADKSGASATATFTVTGPAAEPISALSIFPGTQSITLPLVGQPLQTATYVAIGTNGSTGLQTNVSTQVAWSSTNPLVATINSSGVATALTQGSTTITAIATNTDHSVVTATATLTVAGSASEPLLSIAIVPGAASVGYPGQTSQFLAIGTYTPTPTQPATQNLTTTATWSTSNAAVATVGANTGLVTAQGQGSAVIIVTAQNPDHSVVTGTANFTVINAASQPVSALQIVPGTQSVSKGQNAQFIVLGTSGATGLQSDLTNSPNLTWSSSIPTIATVCNAGPAQPAFCPTTPGQVTGVTAGSTTITAEYANPGNSVVTATAALTVTNTVAISGDIISVTVQPSSQADYYIDQTTQFIAIGTSAVAPYTFDVTNCYQTNPPAVPAPCSGGSTAWASSNVDVATVNTTGTQGPNTGGLGAPAGLATMEWEGVTAITATFTNADGAVATGVATLTCPFGQCILTGPPVIPLATLTVFGAGNNTTNWLITAPSATGAANAIHCGPGSIAAGLGTPVCVGSYPLGTQVTLTTNVTTGTFGGFASGPATITINTGTATNPIYTVVPSPSYCTPPAGQPTQTGVNTCTINPPSNPAPNGLLGDDTVVGIFNN